MLPRKYKLKRDKDFKKIFDKGRCFQGDFLQLRITKNDLISNRFAFIIGVKVSKKAVVRNKVRRQMEEIVRLELNGLKTGYDVVALVRPGIVGRDYQEIKAELDNLFKKAKLVVCEVSG